MPSICSNSNCRNTAIIGKYCQMCGNKVVPLPKCACGNELWPSMMFCINCGLATDQETQTKAREARRQRNPFRIMWRAFIAYLRS